MAAPVIGPPPTSPPDRPVQIGRYVAPDGSIYQVTYATTDRLLTDKAKKAELIRQAGILIEHLKAKGKDMKSLQVSKDSVKVDSGDYTLDEEISQEVLAKYNSGKGLYEIKPNTTLRVAALAISRIFHTSTPEEERLHQLTKVGVQIQSAPSCRSDSDAIELSAQYVNRTASSHNRMSP